MLSNSGNPSSDDDSVHLIILSMIGIADWSDFEGPPYRHARYVHSNTGIDEVGQQSLLQALPSPPRTWVSDFREQKRRGICSKGMVAREAGAIFFKIRKYPVLLVCLTLCHRHLVGGKVKGEGGGGCTVL